MTARRRPAARATAIAVAAVLLLAGCGRAGGAAPTTTDSATSTSIPTTAPTTTSTTDAAAVGPEVTGDGSRFALAPDTAPQPLDDTADPCAGAGDGGFTVDACVATQDMVGLVEHDGSGVHRAVVFQTAGADRIPRLVADSEAGELSSLTVVGADIDGDGDDELVFGFRTAGTGQFLDIDAVDAGAEVVLHRDALPKGEATLAPGRLDTWAAVYAEGDPDCCPNSFQQETIEFVAGAYRLTASAAVDPSAVPKGEL
jgi:hypothetical protein